LIGFYSVDSLGRFATRENLGTGAGYLEERFRGRPWFVVIHSLHSDYASAQAALSALPEDLRDLGPWIRPMAPGTELRALEPASGGGSADGGE
jgi:DamX protein